MKISLSSFLFINLKTRFYLSIPVHDSLPSPISLPLIPRLIELYKFDPQQLRQTKYLKMFARGKRFWSDYRLKERIRLFFEEISLQKGDLRWVFYLFYSVLRGFFSTFVYFISIFGSILTGKRRRGEKKERRKKELRLISSPRYCSFDKRVKQLDYNRDYSRWRITQREFNLKFQKRATLGKPNGARHRIR